MLDAAALVTGGAVASVHFREFGEEIEALTPLGFGFLIVAFGWLALTAAGPFVFLVRRYGRRISGYPGPSDLLWLAFGLPWTLAALYKSGAGSLGGRTAVVYGNVLFIGLALASCLAMLRLRKVWRSLDAPGKPRRTWTEWIGSAVAVSWPLQLGLGFVVTK
jgi:hypothetical protein